jgi:hypothetical protein
MMRAKVRCNSVMVRDASDTVEFTAVCKTGSYGVDGADEDNTYAKFTPSATFTITVTNPALMGRFRPGQKYYVDFTRADA